MGGLLDQKKNEFEEFVKVVKEQRTKLFTLQWNFWKNYCSPQRLNPRGSQSAQV